MTQRTVHDISNRGISNELRQEMRKKLLQGTTFGGRLLDPEARRMLIAQGGIEQIEEIQQNAMSYRRGNFATDTADTVQSWWAGLEVGVGKAALSVYDATRWSARKQLTTVFIAGEPLGQFFDEHIWDTEPTVLHEVVDDWEGVQHRANMRMTGDAGFLREFWKGSLNLGLGLTEFIGVGATRAGAVGIQSLLAMHANETGRSVYDATGSKTQAFTAAGLNFIVSNLIFSRAHKPIANIRAEADKAIRGFDLHQSIKINKLIEAGRIKAATHTAAEILGVTATAVVLREAELGLNTMLQERVGGKGFDAFENNWENFFTTMQSGAMEGLTIALLPAATKALGGVTGFKRNIALKDLYTELGQASRAGESMKNLTARISEATGIKDARSLEDLALQIKERSGGNIILEQVAEVLQKQADAINTGKEHVESKVKPIGEELVNMTHRERSEALRKFSEVVGEIVGEVALGKDSVRLTPEEAVEGRSGLKHETNQEKFDRFLSETVEGLKVEIGEKLPPAVRARMDAAEKFKQTKEMIAIDLVQMKAVEALGALRAEMAEIEAAGKTTPEAVRRKELVSDLIRELSSRVESERATAKKGKLKGDVEIKVEVEGKELGAKELLDLLDSRKTGSIKDGEARSKLIEQLREKLNLPEGMSNKNLLKKIKDALKKSKEPVHLKTHRQILKRVLDAAVEGKIEKLTKEEVLAELETRETAQAREAAERSVRDVKVTAKKLVKELLRKEHARGKKEARSKEQAKADRMKIFREVFKVSGLDKGVRNAILAKVGKDGFKTDASLKKAIGNAAQTVKAEYHKKVSKNLKSALKKRKKSADLHPVIDDVITSLIRSLDPKYAEKIGVEKGKTVDEALDAYVEMRGDHVKPVTDLIKQFAKTKGGVEALTGRQVAFIEMFAGGLTKINSAKRKAQKERERYEDERALAQTNANIASTWNLGKHDIVTDVLGNVKEFAPWSKDLMGIVKTFTYGIEANARLTDAIEYITGSNNTIAHKIMVKNVIDGQNNASLALANAHRLWEAKLKANELTPEDLFKLSDANKKAKNNTINVNGAGTITRAQLIDYLVQAKDLSTLALFVSSNNNLNFSVRGERGHAKEVGWGKEQHEALMEHVGREFSRESRIADVLSEIINDPSIVNPLRAWGVEYYGYDIIQGGVYAHRSVKAGAKETKIGPKDVSGILESINEFTGMGEHQSRNVDLSTTKGRVKEHARSINIGDGIVSTTRYLRATTTLVNLQPALQRATRMATSPGFLAATSQKGPIGAIAGRLVENYYKPIVQQQSAVLTNRSQLSGWISKARNNVVRATLLGKITIPAYQPLSEIAAASYMGAKGQRLMFRANKELGIGRWGRENREAALNRMLENSGLAWERFQIANSYMLMAGEGMQTKHGSITIAGERLGKDGKKVSMITRADRHAILRVYRATELKVEGIFRSKGMEVDYNSPVFKEMVRRTFEDIVVETQPTYEASQQPAILNQAKGESTVSLFTMFRGYTGKLTAMQRIAITRAERAYRSGNYKEAEMHLRKMAEQTLIGSGFVAIIRKLTKTAIRTSIGALMFAELTAPDAEEVKEYTTEMWQDMIAQATGMTVGTGFLMDLLYPSFGMNSYEPSLSPLLDTYTTAMRTSSEVSKGGGGALTHIALAKSIGSLFGLPTIYLETVSDFIREYEKKQKERALEMWNIPINER